MVVAKLSGWRQRAVSMHSYQPTFPFGPCNNPLLRRASVIVSSLFGILFWASHAAAVTLSPGDVIVIDQVRQDTSLRLENRLFQINPRTGDVTKLPVIASHIALDINGYVYIDNDDYAYVSHNGIYKANLVNGTTIKVCCESNNELLSGLGGNLVVDRNGILFVISAYFSSV